MAKHKKPTALDTKPEPAAHEDWWIALDTYKAMCKERDDLAAKLARAEAALKSARDSLLAIRDLAKPYEDNDNFMFSRIVSHAEYGLLHSEGVAKAMGMETLKKPAS